MIGNLLNKIFGFIESIKLMRYEKELDKVCEDIERLVLHKRHLIKRLEKIKEQFNLVESADEAPEVIK